MSIFPSDRMKDGIVRGAEAFSKAAREEADKKRLAGRRNSVDEVRYKGHDISVQKDGETFRVSVDGTRISDNWSTYEKAVMAANKRIDKGEFENGFAPKEEEPFGAADADPSATGQESQGIENAKGTCDSCGKDAELRSLPMRGSGTAADSWHGGSGNPDLCRKCFDQRKGPSESWEKRNEDSSGTGFQSAEKTTTAERADFVEKLENAGKWAPKKAEDGWYPALDGEIDDRDWYASQAECEVECKRMNDNPEKQRYPGELRKNSSLDDMVREVKETLGKRDTIPDAVADKLMDIIHSADEEGLRRCISEGIKFAAPLARNELNRRGLKNSEKYTVKQTSENHWIISGNGYAEGFTSEKEAQKAAEQLNRQGMIGPQENASSNSDLCYNCNHMRSAHTPACPGCKMKCQSFVKKDSDGDGDEKRNAGDKNFSFNTYTEKHGKISVSASDAESAWQKVAQKLNISVGQAKEYLSLENAEKPMPKSQDRKNSGHLDAASWEAASTQERSAWLEAAGQDLAHAASKWSDLSMDAQVALQDAKEMPASGNNGYGAAAGARVADGAGSFESVNADMGDTIDLLENTGDKCPSCGSTETFKFKGAHGDNTSCSICDRTWDSTRKNAANSKCIKCDKSLPIDQMVKNVHGAGFLCKEDAKAWNKDNSKENALAAEDSIPANAAGKGYRYSFTDSAGAVETIVASNEGEAWEKLANEMSSTVVEMKGMGVKLKGRENADGSALDAQQIEREAEGILHEVKEIKEEQKGGYMENSKQTQEPRLTYAEQEAIRVKGMERGASQYGKIEKRNQKIVPPSPEVKK